MKVTEIFHSDIRSDDAKLFTFSIISIPNLESNSHKGNDDNSNKQKKTRQGKGKKNNNKGKNNKQRSNEKETRQDRMTNELETRLAERLAETNYCRKGFFELERNFTKTTFTVRGECNESATVDDRNNFIKVE